MKIVAGDTTIIVKGIYGAPVYHNGVLVDSLKISLPGDITGEELADLCENSWEIYSDEGLLQSVHAGCNYIEEYSLTFLKLTEQARFQALLEEAQEKAALYRNALVQVGVNPSTLLTLREKNTEVAPSEDGSHPL